MKIPTLIKLIIAILISEIIGGIGSIFTIPSIGKWYATLVRPEMVPPNWIFGPVWVTLFALMGIASYLVWQKGLGDKKVRIALIFFIIQFVLNILWSFVFFGLHNPGLAFAEIIILWLAILSTTLSFYRVSKEAGYLLVPYILWVSFAGYLNYMIWTLN